MPDPNTPGPGAARAGAAGQDALRPHPADPGAVQARTWNPQDRRLFTPKAFGWGYDINLYWLAHPVRFLTGRP